MKCTKSCAKCGFGCVKCIESGVSKAISRPQPPAGFAEKSVGSLDKFIDFIHSREVEIGKRGYDP